MIKYRIFILSDSICYCCKCRKTLVSYIKSKPHHTVTGFAFEKVMCYESLMDNHNLLYRPIVTASQF